MTPEQAERLLRDEAFNIRLRQQHEISKETRAEERVFKRHLVARMGASLTGSSLPPTIADMSPTDKRHYSLTRLINSMMQPGGRDPMPSLEREVSRSLALDLKQPPPNGGCFVPMVLGLGLDTKSNAGGAYSVETKVLDILPAMRSASICVRLGAAVLSGLRDDVAIPTQTSASTATWSSENPGSDVSDSDSAFGQLRLVPKTLTATTSYSRQLFRQASPDVEQFLRSDLAVAHAVAIDAAALNGKGNSAEPLGLLNTSAVPVSALGTNGSGPTAGLLYTMEQAVSDASADVFGTLAWATSPAMKAKLRVLPLFTGATVPCWTVDEAQDALIGLPAVVSKAIPQTLVKGGSTDCHAIILGYWPSLVIGTWGILEIVVDQFAKKRTGELEITSFQMVDICVRRPTAFVACVDARNI